MNDEERYLFDVQGYLVIKNAIAPEALAEMNAWLDVQAERDPAFHGRPTNEHLYDILTWGSAFRALLDNPRVLPYLKELMGDTLRLDHDYAIFLQPGGMGMRLHGGATPYDPSQYYHCYHGRMYSGLTVAVYALTDVPPGAGGFACVPGSHKASFPCPMDILLLQKRAPIVQVPAQAGDCIVFTEALTHGTLPWTAGHVRRTLYFKYSPSHSSWAGRYYFPAEGNPAVQALESELTETQRILLDPPAIDAHRHVP